MYSIEICLYVPIDTPSYGIVYALRQAINGRGGGVSGVDHCWLIIICLFVAVLLVGREGKLQRDAGAGDYGVGCVGCVGGVAGDDGVGSVGAGPALSSTQH